jgi:FtsP/CotA-like multicopper oxidase with cupredoxin domain
VFHIHGYSVYVVGIAEKVRNLPLETLKVMDSRGLLMHRNLKNPIQKDTISVPKGGAVALRFFADNPGKNYNI